MALRRRASNQKVLVSEDTILRHAERDLVEEQWRYDNEHQIKKYWYPKIPSQELRLTQKLNGPW
jgi:hypothetical protein